PTVRKVIDYPSSTDVASTPRAARPKEKPLGALLVVIAHPVLRRRDNWYWEMPGGVLEPAEQPEDGARREVILEAREARWMTRDEITAPWIHPMQSVCWVPPRNSHTPVPTTGFSSSTRTPRPVNHDDLSETAMGAREYAVSYAG